MANISDVQMQECLEEFPSEVGTCLEREIAVINSTRQEYLATLPCSGCGIYSEAGMILCDGCDSAWHLSCINLVREPTIYWYCA